MISLEYYRKGDRELYQPFTDELNDFPVGTTSYGINANIILSFLKYNNIDGDIKILHNFKSHSINNIFNAKPIQDIMIRINYSISNDIL